MKTILKQSINRNIEPTLH